MEYHKEVKIINHNTIAVGFLGGARGKESTCRCRFDSWVGKIPSIGNGNLFQYSCLENPMDKEAWWAIVHGITKS